MARAVVWAQSANMVAVPFAGVGGAAYYIDYANGSDSNSGKSSLTPWQHCPGDSRATGLASSTPLIAGNIVAFKGGVTYTGSGTGTLISIGAFSGNHTGGYITYRGNVGNGNWGVGPALIDLNNTYSRFMNTGALNYIKIQNYDIKGAANQSSSIGAVAGSPGPTCANDFWAITRSGVDMCAQYTGSGNIANSGVIRTIGNSTNWIITGNIFHEPQNWNDQSAIGSSDNFSTNGSLTPNVPCQVRHIIFQGPTISNITISDNEFYACGQDCIVIQGTDNVTISGNNFGGTNRDPSLTGYFSVAIRAMSTATIGTKNTNLLITGNTFHDGWQYEGDDSQGRSHAGDWFHIYGSTVDSQGPITLTGNTFYNNKAFAFVEGSAMNLIENNFTTMNYWNNIFINPHAGLGSVAGGVSVNTFHFENNVIIAYTATVGSGIITNGNSTIRNNIWVHFGSGATTNSCNYDSQGTTPPGALPSISDYNVYYTPNGAAAWRFGSTFYTLANWQTFSSQDANSVTSNPLFVNLPADGSTSSALNAMLDIGSPAFNTGVDLSALFSLAIDGTIRPQTLIWDRGVYER